MLIFPYTTVLDEAKRFPAAILNGMRPHFCGGHAELRRYAVVDEKELCLLGEYDGSETTWNWPNRTVGSILDESYVKLFIDDALLLYYENLVGSGDAVARVANYNNRIKITPAVSGAGWKENTATYPRLTLLYDRDVAIGDIVWLRGTHSAVTKELWTYVADLIATPSAAVIAAATADAGNAPTQIASKSPSQTAGAQNYVEIADASAVSVTDYDGLPSGDVDETYTIVVTQGSTGGDATTALLSVTSASGRDDAVDVVPAAFASATAIGSRGMTVTFTIDNTRLVDPFTATSDFIEGQTFEVVIEQAITATTGTSGGTFTGTEDVDYTVECVRGGRFNLPVSAPTANPAVTPSDSGGSLAADTYSVKVTYTGVTGETTPFATPTTGVVTAGTSGSLSIASPPVVAGATGWKLYISDNASDYYLHGTTRSLGVAAAITAYTGSGDNPPVSNTAVYANPLPPQLSITAEGKDSGLTNLTAANTATAIGTLGVTFKSQAGGTGLVKGDKWYISVTAPAGTTYQTIVLGNNLNDTLKNATDLDVRLYIKKNLQLTQDKIESPPDQNYSFDDSDITISAGATAYDSSWTDDGEQMPLPISGGTAYAEYRSWLQTYVGTVGDVTTSDATVLEDAFGPLHPDNPLGYAVSLASPYVNEYAIKVSAVSDPTDLDSWDAMLEMLEGYEGIHDLVPLTTDTAVFALYRTHVAAMSTDAVGQWRRVWETLTVDDTYAIVDSTTTVESDSGLAEGEVANGTISDNPLVTGTQYTQFDCTTTNANFVTLGVRAGDTVRFLYSTDGFGNDTYEEFVVGEVVNEDSLILETGHSEAVASAQRFEIWRTRTKNELASALVAKATAADTYLVVPVWPDSIEVNGTSVAGYYAAAVAAALASGVASHQGLREVEIPVFTGVTRSASYFNLRQLRTLSDGGIFVITQSSDGTVYVFSAKSSDVSTVQTSEEMCGRATHAIKYHIRGRVAQYFGKANASESMLDKAATELRAGFAYLRSATDISDRLGPLLVSGRITDIRYSETEEDRMVITGTAEGPAPLNKITLAIPFPAV